MRKSDRKLNSGGVQLLILAVSDIGMSLYWALGSILRVLMENNPMFKNLITMLTLFAYGMFNGGIVG
jgi:hypothetical protein